MAEHSDLYRHTLYYDIALSRDITREVNFLTTAYEHYTGQPLESVLMLACGPGYHSHEFAKRGIRAIGLDLLPEMIELAKQKAERLGTDVEWVAADMRDFHIEPPIDLVAAVFDAIDALLTDDDILQHFHSVAASLTPGGLYIIEYTHPRSCSLADYGSFRYTGERDGIHVDIHWATNNPVFDPATGVATVETEMHVNDHGKETVIKATAQERLLTPGEIRLLARLSGVLEVAGWHGDFDVSQPFDNSPQSERMIVVLRKPTDD